MNQTDKGGGHIIIDYPRLLNHGLGAPSPSSKRTAPGNRRTLYQAVLILLEASQRHILRYAALAEEMAGHCQDPQRQQELLTIAAISRHNAQHQPTDFPGLPAVLVYEYHSAIRIQRQLDFTRTL